MRTESSSTNTCLDLWPESIEGLADGERWSRHPRHRLTRARRPMGDTFARDRTRTCKMDYVMPIRRSNIKGWARNEEDPRWRFGVPPANNTSAHRG